jgi:hypothetical protein
MRTTTAIAATGLAFALCAANVGIGAADTVSSRGEPQWSAVENDPVSKYLDLPLVNSQGELSGGIHPALPTDLATLEDALDSVRAKHIPPARYTALLWQYWLVRSTTDAGIDLTSWAPARGAEANKNTIFSAYTFYGKLFLAYPELQWAGMANMVGPSFAAGFLDIGATPDVAALLAEKIDTLPLEARTELPRELTDLARYGVTLSPVELQWFEAKLVAMQKHIFMDQASMHEAYLTGGTTAIAEMRAAGLIDDSAVAAWRAIATSRTELIEDANTHLLSREQNQIIAAQWNQMREHHGPIGGMVTYAITLTGSVSIPGAKTPAQYSPLTISTETRNTTPRLVLTTPLPSFNIADQADRWIYITHDTLPAYQRIVHDYPTEARQIIASPVEDRVAQQRLAARWPQLATHLITSWHLSATCNPCPHQFRSSSVFQHVARSAVPDERRWSKVNAPELPPLSLTPADHDAICRCV